MTPDAGLSHRHLPDHRIPRRCRRGRPYRPRNRPRGSCPHRSQASPRPGQERGPPRQHDQRHPRNGSHPLNRRHNRNRKHRWNRRHRRPPSQRLYRNRRPLNRRHKRKRKRKRNRPGRRGRSQQGRGNRQGRERRSCRARHRERAPTFRPKRERRERLPAWPRDPTTPRHTALRPGGVTAFRSRTRTTRMTASSSPPPLIHPNSCTNYCIPRPGDWRVFHRGLLVMWRYLSLLLLLFVRWRPGWLEWAAVECAMGSNGPMSRKLGRFSA